MDTHQRIKAAAVLDHAALRIDSTGLWRGGFYPGWTKDDDTEVHDETTVGDYLREHHDLPCCTIGAIAASAPDSFTSDDAQRALADHIGLPTWLHLAPWSDDSLRTDQDVVDAMRETAECLRADAAADQLVGA